MGKPSSEGPKTDRLVFIGSVGSFLTGLAALVTILVTWTIYRNQVSIESQRDQQLESRQDQQNATALYRSYLELSLAKPDLFKKGSTEINSFIITTAESIYIAQEGDKGWEETVANMLNNNREILEAGQWDCDTFDKDFRKFATQKVHLRLHCESNAFSGGR